MRVGLLESVAQPLECDVLGADLGVYYISSAQIDSGLGLFWKQTGAVGQGNVTNFRNQIYLDLGI